MAWASHAAHGMHPSFRRPQAGQAHVEAAFALPLVVAFTLGIFQLTCLQHARLMAEYAAFCAARAGIVWSGNNERMRDAAFLALMPTVGRTDDPAALTKTLDAAAQSDRTLAAWGLGRTGVQLAEGFDVNLLRGMVRVDTVQPALTPELAGVWKLQGGAAWTELDFDGVDSFPQRPEAEAFFAMGRRDPAQAILRRSTVLSVRLRYFYELKIPFANWFVFTAWYAKNAGVVLKGAVDRPSNLAQAASAGRGIGGDSGLALVTPDEMRILWSVSTAGRPGLGRRFFIPLSASCTQRMQSNFFRKWIMHEGSPATP